MSPRQGVHELGMADDVRVRQTHEACKQAQNDLAKAVMEGQGSEALSQAQNAKIWEAMGKVRMCSTIDEYEAAASARKAAVRGSIVYDEKTKIETLGEAYSNTLKVASTQMGQNLGEAGTRAAEHAAKHGVGGFADVMFPKEKKPNPTQENPEISKTQTSTAPTSSTPQYTAPPSPRDVYE